MESKTFLSFGKEREVEENEKKTAVTVLRTVVVGDRREHTEQVLLLFFLRPG